MRTPYTYLLGWSNHNKWYYGVRFAKNCKPEELWETYKTSSGHVKDFVEEYGDPDIIQIRKVFENVYSARKWESKVLKRMNVVKDDRFLNKTDNRAIDIESCRKGGSVPKSMEMRMKRLGSKHTEETKRKISIAHKGRKTPWLTGKIRPEHSKFMTGSGNSNAKKIIYDGKMFGTCKELTKEAGISLYKINKMIREKQIQVLEGVK